MEDVRLEFGLEDQIELTIQLYLGSSPNKNMSRIKKRFSALISQEKRFLDLELEIQIPITVLKVTCYVTCFSFLVYRP